MTQQIAAPSHLAFRQGVHIQMMNIHRSSRIEDVLREYQLLKEEEAFTDLVIATGDGERRRAHSLVVAAGSEFLKSWMESTLLHGNQNVRGTIFWRLAYTLDLHTLQYTILLPDVHSSELDILLSILYGTDITVPGRMVERLDEIADLLRISVDLPFRTLNDQHLQRRQDPSRLPPLCCWHCNQTFDTLDYLQAHVTTHQGERFKKMKKHKCLKCNKVRRNLQCGRNNFNEPMHKNGQLDMSEFLVTLDSFMFGEAVVRFGTTVWVHVTLLVSLQMKSIADFSPAQNSSPL